MTHQEYYKLLDDKTVSEYEKNLLTIKFAIQQIGEAYNTAETPHQIDAKDRCSDALIILNSLLKQTTYEHLSNNN